MEDQLRANRQGGKLTRPNQARHVVPLDRPVITAAITQLNAGN